MDLYLLAVTSISDGGLVRLRHGMLSMFGSGLAARLFSMFP